MVKSVIPLKNNHPKENNNSTVLSWHGLLLFFISFHCPEELMLHVGEMRCFAPRTHDSLMAELGTAPSIAPAFCWTMLSKPYRYSFVPPALLKLVSHSCPWFMLQWPVLLAKPEPQCRQDEAQPELSAPARENSLC